MSGFVVMSPNYELLRYGHDCIKKQVEDAHTLGKKAKLVVGVADLKSPDADPHIIENYRFESRQAAEADIVLFVCKGKESIIIK